MKIDEIRAREQAAMIGPWYVDDVGTQSDEGEDVCIDVDRPCPRRYPFSAIRI